MSPKKIVAALDIKDGKVVKSIKFVDTKAVGDPVERAIEYSRQGADEIVFLDISATNEGRGILLDLVKKVAANVTAPFTVGGGVRTIEDMQALFDAGADKVFMNSAAIKNPELIKEAAEKFGSERIAVAIDAKRLPSGKYIAVISGGFVDTDVDVVEWAKKVESLGAGEIHLNSMETDGVQGGFDLAITGPVSSAVSIPVVASSGAGKLEDFAEVFEKTNVSAALAASVFHYGTLTVGEVKAYLADRGIPVIMPK